MPWDGGGRGHNFLLASAATAKAAELKAKELPMTRTLSPSDRSLRMYGASKLYGASRALEHDANRYLEPTVRFA
jgi:hypothetical protein